MIGSRKFWSTKFIFDKYITVNHQNNIKKFKEMKLKFHDQNVHKKLQHHPCNHLYIKMIAKLHPINNNIK